MKGKLKTSLLGTMLAVWAVMTWSSVGRSMDMRPYFPLSLGKVRLVKETVKENGNIKVTLERHQTTYKINLSGRDVYVKTKLDPNCWELEMEGEAWDNEGYKYVGEIKCEDGEMNYIIFDPPILFLPVDMTLGEKRTWDLQGGGTISATLEAVGELVQVPAGTFTDTIRLSWQTLSDGESNTCTLWAAPHTGIVKSHCIETDENGSEESIDELVALMNEGRLTGSPVMPEYPFSFFGLATLSTNQCGMAINNIIFERNGIPEIWWANFVFDTKTLSWMLNDAGPGQNIEPPQAPCSIEGLDFGGSTLKDLANIAGVPELRMKVGLGGKHYGVKFRFNVSQLRWELMHDIATLD